MTVGCQLSALMVRSLVAENWYGLIMAGGEGTRLWPASRRARPKQFLPLLPAGETLLGATFERLKPLIPAERILVVTARSQADAVRQAIPELPAHNLVAEPVGRNTAACIGLGAIEIRRRQPDALLAVVPADQFIGEPEPFRVAVRRALAVAGRGAVSTIGIRPTRPETGFGYIELGHETEPGVHRVDRFVEKPDRLTAEAYLASGRHLWNSGMFFFGARRILDALAHQLPALGRLLAEIERDASAVDRLYPGAEAISIDYGVMERLGPGEVQVVPGEFGWDDVGSFRALETLLARDGGGNVLVGETALVDATGNIVVGGAGRLVAAIGVSDLVIVATGDAVLVVPKERAQEVRELVRALARSGRETYL